MSGGSHEGVGVAARRARGAGARRRGAARGRRGGARVCLGAQLLARGLGARVYRGPRAELGIAPIALTGEGRGDPLLAPLDGQAVVHWHQDTFDLPAGAVRLASTADYPNQAFRFGARAYGVQFHIELDRPARRPWARLGEGELRAAGVDPASLDGGDGLDQRGRAFARAVYEEAQRASAARATEVKR